VRAIGACSGTRGSGWSSSGAGDGVVLRVHDTEGELVLVEVDMT
jgi:hypothetical protein